MVWLVYTNAPQGLLVQLRLSLTNTFVFLVLLVYTNAPHGILVRLQLFSSQCVLVDGDACLHKCSPWQFSAVAAFL